MRKRKPKLRQVAPDPRYGDQQVTRFVNMMMLDGKKSTAFKVFYAAMDIMEDKAEESAYETFQKALKNVMPAVEVRSSYWWCYIPNSYRNPSGAPRISWNEMVDQIRSSAFR